MKLKKRYIIPFKGEKIIIDDFITCRTILSRARGLMFRINSKPLLFVFKKPGRISIHSFFVWRPFLAVWMLNNRIIDVRAVFPWKLGVTPQKKFNLLLEIPLKSVGSRNI